MGYHSIILAIKIGIFYFKRVGSAHHNYKNNISKIQKKHDEKLYILERFGPGTFNI